MGAKEWAQRLETLLETGELAGWAGIGFLLINPTSQNLGPNWGSVSAAREGGQDPLLPAAVAWMRAESGFCTGGPRDFLRPCFPGHRSDGLLWWRPPQRGQCRRCLLQTCSRSAGLGACGRQPAEQGDPSPVASAHQRPQGWSHQPFPVLFISVL